MQYMYNRALYTYMYICTYMHPHWKPLHHCVHGLATGVIKRAYGCRAQCQQDLLFYSPNRILLKC